MSILILVRHVQSVYNLENRFIGNLDVALTRSGKEEARQTGIKLKSYTFDRAYTSMLTRAQGSLRIILDVIDQTEISVVKNAALNERMYGSLQGLNKDETRKKQGAEQVEIWRRSYDICPPERESLATTFDRTVP
jgi:2,3-bisphosphoglycerate-dependent phosphoglycerate mutase